MANFRIRIAAALAALASLLPAQENTNPPGSDSKPTDAAGRVRGVTIGVVDLDKAIDQYPKAIAERDRLQKLLQELGDRLNAESKRIDGIKADLSLLKEGSDQRELKEWELGKAMNDHKALASLLRAQFDRQVERFEIAIYQDLELAVAQVAKDRGVQIVLRVRPQGVPSDGGKEPANAQQARLQGFNRRDVWYHADEVDLTPALIKYLLVPIDVKKIEGGKPEAGKSETPPAPKPAGNGNGGL